MKFAWKGKMNAETIFTYPDLPMEAKPLVNEKRAWLMYLIIIPLLAFAYLFIQIRRPSFNGVLFTRPALFIGIGFALLFLPIHEFIHAVFCPRNATILIYFTGSGISLIPTCSLQKIRYVVMAFMPTFILGIVPLALWLLLPRMTSVISSILFAFSIGSLSMCIGDIYNAILAIAKMPRGSVLVTSGTNCYYF